MTYEITLTNIEASAFHKTLNYAKKLAAENKWAIGVGEMAIGAGLVSWGINHGVIEMGTQLIATKLADKSTVPFLGAVAGGGIGATAGSIIGSIGIAGMGGAIGIPAALVAGGAAAVLSMAGYTSMDIIQNIATNSIDIAQFAFQGSVLVLGVALIADGARRIIKDKKILAMFSQFKDKAILLKKLLPSALSKTTAEHQTIAKETTSAAEKCAKASLGISSVAIGTCLGASTGSAIAASSVTVLGSKAIGVAAVSMGLASAPAWPVIVGITGGAGLGLTAYKVIKTACTGRKDK